ncbi:hypothetical protein ACUY3K_09205 [Corynebacterium uberis]|uniref:hypothetical protein n=1 Tax=Corynebacterium TaxID=1716 RepID=UPI001D09C46B|nr:MULTISPECIES: hypothetical protein [Corynebacterium]MCZ9308485.1 hypothetical protein [Corynebacterium sp. c6VSa_13]UDL74146.1 hypothetical protein LH391_02670 [Corynebacterium uberis]UDL74970.1 hypothetical protein LH393_06735 [Corynebacterium uberis]UDL77185.1 hypothetical protein LH394_06725 [Corynebacterium uberis]UDL79467.1 hypothetical protein LH392_07140 [Corynebacterium uberis]
MTHLRFFDLGEHRDISGTIQPTTALEDFVFMANLQAQEATGDMAVSVTTGDVVTTLGEDSHVRVAAILQSNQGVAGTSTCPDPERLPAVYDSTGPDPTADIECTGYIHLSAPVEEHDHALICEVVPDADFQPVSDLLDADHAARITDFWCTALDALIAYGHRTGRTYLQVWRRRPPTTSSHGADPAACALRRAGFELHGQEDQWVIPGAAAPAPAPAETAHASVTRTGAVDLRCYWDFDFPETVTSGILKLYEQADTDSPHGQLVQRPAPWTRQRLWRARTRLHRAGCTALTVVVLKEGTPVAISEVTLDFAALADAAGGAIAVAEHTATVVDAACRGHGLGTACTAALAAALGPRWRIYSANDHQHEAMTRINELAGGQRLCRLEAWDRRL